VKGLANSLGVVVIALLALAAVAPILISLSHALVPVLIIAVVGAAGLRLLWFRTRRF
jgi:hypothetical protein